MKTYYIDGYTRFSNPCIEGGYTITDQDGKIIEQNILKSDSETKTITNNYTEFMGLCRTIEIAEEGSEIKTDSKNNLSWINLNFPRKSKRKDLIPVAKVYNTMYKNKNLHLSWVKRDYNLAGIVNENQFNR